MRILILGGTGYLGPQITARLLAANHEVNILRRGVDEATTHPGVNIIHGDRNNLEQSTEALRGLHPDVVIDLIAFTQSQAESLLTVFRGQPTRIVVLSSGDVYRANDILFRRVEGALEPTPLTESSPLRERLYPYRGIPIPYEYGFAWDDYDKILVEQTIMHQHDMPATVLRLPMIYGPGAHHPGQRRFFPYLKRMDDHRETILLDERTANWRAPWGYSGDVAGAVKLAVENDHAAGKIFNVGERESLDMRGWIQELALAAGWHGKIVTSTVACPPPSLPLQLNLEQHLDMDTTKIRSELGYRETLPRREALAITVAWEREHWPTEIDSAQFDYLAEDAILRLSSPPMNPEPS